MLKYILFSTFAVVTGFLIDLIVGDPRGIPHIIILIGRLIGLFEKAYRRLFPKTKTGERLAGLCLVLSMFLFVCCIGAVIGLGYYFCIWVGYALESILCWQLLCVKDLRKESMAVYKELRKENLPSARYAVSMIVGRDTERLDASGVAKAAVETVAENTSDGIIAPLFYMLLGGGILGCLYKTVNTMDSMVGYTNEKFIHVGRYAAKIDDVFNFIPARLSALLMIASSRFCGMNAANAWKIFRRDRYKHASPNSAQTESVCAGALEVQLAGDAWYFGELHKKEFIGDPIRPVEPEDIPRSNRLMMGTVLLMMALFVLIRTAVILGGFFYVGF